MKKLLICAAAIALTTTACKKQNTNHKPDTPIDTVLPVQYYNYTMLTRGNYWIYQDYSVDSPGAVHVALGRYDSCYVEKDTLINGNTYHKYMEPLFGSTPPNLQYDIYYLRDSLSYIVNQQGRIMFSSDNFGSIFRFTTQPPNAASPDTVHVMEFMAAKDSVIQVEAGSFNTSTFRQSYVFPASYRYGPIRSYDRSYARNVGLVSYTTGFYYSSRQVYERQLVRYHVR